MSMPFFIAKAISGLAENGMTDTKSRGNHRR
jgi:hypothetical protein